MFFLFQRTGPERPGGTSARADEPRPIATLRTGEDYDAFADADRAQSADGGSATIGNFLSVTRRGGETVEVPFSNQAELWNQIAPSVRDDLLLAGDEFVGSAVEDVDLAPTVATVMPQQGGKPQVMYFLGDYRTAQGEAEVRVRTFLLETDRQRTGRVVADLAPFELSPSSYSTVEELLTAVESRSVELAESYKGG